MRRRLMIMRHAKSSWRSQVPTDHERPLNTRGRRDAGRVGKRLARLGWVLDVVVGSDSRRTRETWERMERRFPETRARFTRALYAGGPMELRTEVCAPVCQRAHRTGPRSQSGLGGSSGGAERPRGAAYDGERRTAGGRGGDVGRGAAARLVERRQCRPPEGALTASVTCPGTAARASRGRRPRPRGGPAAGRHALERHALERSPAREAERRQSASLRFPPYRRRGTSGRPTARAPWPTWRYRRLRAAGARELPDRLR
jgi:hypothetical protein